MLQVDLEGFAALQAGRPAWNFVRELVSNAWDEEITACSVTIEKEGNKLAVIRIIDDGPGFADLKDAYTLFGHTPKRSDPTVRGRFNLGEKELAAIAGEMEIKTTKGTVRFTRDRKLEVKKGKDFRTSQGTEITAQINWTKVQVEESIEMLRKFLTPAGIDFKVNGKRIEAQPPSFEIEGTLPTVIFSDGAIRPTKRKTAIRLINSFPEENGWLYEMGIPVQPIDCPYHVDVQQKVPLSPNRESVSDGYLKDIYAYVLEATIDRLEDEDISQQWVRTATEDDLVTDDTVEKVREKRYGDAVLWSSDPEANRRAMEAGKDVVHPKTMSPVERSRFQIVGMEHSSSAFGVGEPIDPTPTDKWDDNMRHMAATATRIWSSLFPYEETVIIQFTHDGMDRMQAGYRNGILVINTASFMSGAAQTDPYWFLSLLAHEFAHRKGLLHDEEWQNELIKVTAKIIDYAVAEAVDNLQ